MGDLSLGCLRQLFRRQIGGTIGGLSRDGPGSVLTDLGDGVVVLQVEA